MNKKWHQYEEINASLHKRFGNRLIKKQNKGRRVDKALNVSNKISQNLIYLGEILIVGIFSFSTLIFGNGNLTPNNTQLVYPLNGVSTIDCRTQEWADLGVNCKVQLPIIKGANYDMYSNNQLYRDIYTVLFGGHYKDGWAISEGSHYGVDISSAKGTPLYAIANGKVYFAWEQRGYGNVVKIQFMYNGTLYFATYGHMDQILVKTGQPISIGQKLGTVGNSGSTMGGLGGYHVHFEINKNTGGRPYYPFYKCPEVKESGIDTINAGACRKEMFQYSHDPIAFLEQANAYLPHIDWEHWSPIASAESQYHQWEIQSATLSGEVIALQISHGSGVQMQVDKNVEIPKDSPSIAPTLLNTTTLNQKNESLIALDTSKLDIVGKDFFEQWNVVFSGELAPSFKKGEESTLKLLITNKETGLPYQGILKQPIILVTNSTNLHVDPVAISLVQDGEVKIKLKALQNWAVYTAINVGLNKVGGFSSQIF